MLHLSRKEGERVFIGEDIVVTVVQIQQGKVRIGIEADPKMLILREELAKKEKTKKE